MELKKSILIYYSKHGCTEKISKLIAKEINSDIVNILDKESKDTDFESYDNIVIGTSIYAGQVNKKMKNFILENKEMLLTKNLGLFICGLNEKEFETEFTTAFGEDLRKHAKVKGLFCGEIIFKKLNFFEKLIVKKIMKTDKDICKVNEETIKKFAKRLK